MKILRPLILVASASVFSSCADFKLAGLSVETPYGTINTDKQGSTTVILKPIVVHEK